MTNTKKNNNNTSPELEDGVVILQNKEHKQMFRITQNKITKMFILYDISDGKNKKLGEDISPTKLEKRFKTEEKLKKSSS